MNPSQKMGTKALAGGRLATSAQPARATSFFPSWLPSAPTAQPIPRSLVLRTNGMRQESLGCCGLPPVLFGETISEKPIGIFLW